MLSVYLSRKLLPGYTELVKKHKEVAVMLMRTDPFREFDRLTQQAFGTKFRPAVMPMDAYRQDDQFVVNFDLPGVDPSSIDLTVEKNVLSVSAERRWEAAEDVQIVASERPQGTFNRQLFLGEGLDADRVEASYDNGVLSVTIPVAEQAKPRKVAISAGADARTIEASATES
jgi:HSP20 family protein